MILIDRRHRIAECQCSQLFETVVEERIRAYHKRPGTRLAEAREGLFKFCVAAYAQYIELDSEF